MHQIYKGNVSGRQLSWIGINEFTISDPIGCRYVDPAHISVGGEKKTKQRISVLVFPSDEVLYLPLTITISQI